jgi:ABC-2 type transport system permease protein
VRKLFALVRADGLTALSYRLETLVSFGGLLVTVVPLYFVAQALQPVMARSIADEGRQYFGFLVIGMIAMLFLITSVNALPEAIRAGIGRGTLEALLATPTPLAVLLAGMTGYQLLWTLARAAVLLVAAWVLGAQVAWDRGLVGLGILLLIVVAHVPFAIATAALIIAFKTPGPFARGALTLSGLLGGVYYPTHVIPSWLHSISALLPLTYGLRALRRTLLDGASVGAVAGDVAILGAFAVVLLGASLAALAWALRYARRAGSLSLY